MKAKIKATGEIVNVIDIYPEEINGEPANPFVQYYRNKDREEVYGDFELDFNISASEKAVIEGEICRTRVWNKERNTNLWLITESPKDENGNSVTTEIPIPYELFPSVTWQSEPVKARIEITFIDEKE